MVVVNGNWLKNVASYPGSGDVIVTSKMAARAVLICRPNSHPFQERSLTLDQPVKIGRSVARARAVPNNAIFDCKVLSRNHALLWYENGKFYLQDTKSSNGTFVNNQRLSKGAEESPPREVCSGDIVQFGVDVMENARKVTHGCIVATLKLYLPDGKEAKASPSTSVVSSVGMVPLEDLYQLNQYLQDAIGREQILENKLTSLQLLVESTRQAADIGWKALIDEDRLLSRVEVLENQLQLYSKNFAEDKLREELRNLQEDKSRYQTTAKESLRKVLQEKIEAVQKVQDLEQNLSNTENECANLKKVCEQCQSDLQDLAQKYSLQLQHVEDLTAKLEDSEEQNRELCDRLEQEKRELEARLQEQLKAEQALQLRFEALQLDGDLSQQKLAALQSHLHLLRSNDDNEGDSKLDIDKMKEVDSTGTQVDVILERIDPTVQDNMKEEVESLRYQLKKYEEELQSSHELVNQLHNKVELIELEEKDRQDKVTYIKVQLEDMHNLEDTNNETTIELQQRLDEVERELNHLQCENGNNKNNATQSPHPMNKLKAEKVKLEELLQDARSKKRSAELQRGQFQLELDCANIKVKKTTEEANVLKQQLATAQCQMNAKNETVQELQKQMRWLENSADEMKQQVANLQERVHEEQLQKTKCAAEAEQLRKQLMEAQQSAKQSRNEAEQMKDRQKALVEELESSRHTGPTGDGDNRSREELEALQEHCDTVAAENDRLKFELEETLDLKQELVLAKNEISLLKLRVQKHELIESSDSTITEFTDTEDIVRERQVQAELEIELISIKEDFAHCNEEKTRLRSDLEKLQEEYGTLANQSHTVPYFLIIPMALTVVAILMALDYLF